MKIVTFVCGDCGIEIDKGHRTCDACKEKNKLKFRQEYYKKNRLKISKKSKEIWQRIKNCPKLHRKRINQIRKYQEKNRDKLATKQRENYQNKEKIERVKYKEEVCDEIYDRLKHEVLKI